MRPAHRFLALACALSLSLASAAQAQGPVSTGSFAAGRDLNWDVQVGTGAFVDAYQVLVNPGWAGFYSPTGARFISFAGSASSPGGSPYTFRTSFNLSGYDPSTAFLSYQCGLDNFLVGIKLNGNAVSGACPFGDLGSPQSLSSGFNAGLNTLDFIVSGDGTTDGFIYNTVGFSAAVVSAPEPSTIVLFATGFAGIGFIRRRRAL